MEATQSMARNQFYSAMNEDKPYASYRKTIEAQAAVTVWDNFEEKPMQIIVKGSPRREPENCIIDVWSEKEKVFLERMNRNHFRNGILVPYTRPDVQEEVEKPIEQASDEELTKIVNSKFLALQATLNKIETTAVLFRLRGLAEDNDKSDKIIKAIEARIAELQAGEYQPKANAEEE